MKDRAKGLIQSLRGAVAHPGWRRSKPARWTIGICLTLAVAALFPSARTIALSGYSVGSLWTSEDVVAPFTFPVYKESSRYGQDIRKSLEELYPVYLPDTNADNISVLHFRGVWDRMVSILELSRRDSLASLSLLDSAKELGLNKDDWNSLSEFAQSKNDWQFDRSEKGLAETEAFLVKRIGEIESRSLITLDGKEGASPGSSRFFALRLHTNEEVLVSRDSLLTIDAAGNMLYSALADRLKHDATLLHPISKLAQSVLLPSVIFNDSLTQESRQAIIDRVPRTDGIAIEGQKIISKGEIITPKAQSELESLSRARLERGGMVAELARFAGTVGHAGLLILLLVLYLKFIRRRIYNDNAQLLLISLVLLFPAVLAYLSVRVQVDFPLQYFILVPVSAMLLTVLFDSRTGFYGTVVASLIVAGIRGNDYSIALAGLCAGSFAAYTVRDLRNRAQLFTSIWYIFIGYLIAIAALSLEDGTPMREVGFELVSSLGNALVSPAITLALLYVFELFFENVSDLRLAEFDNINHPLLRELALRAPGTYQHTMMVAQLSENAAIAIGANAGLVKAGAYFHDVGKLTYPLSFVENQSTESGNVHENLTARESAERVMSHVQQGIDLARAHGLPERVIDFIPMHHGTLPISFFYQLALAEAKPGEVIDEKDFRYPGPIPNSKETAVLMLADASEAISRSLAQSGGEMSTESVELAVEQLIRTRFEQGQFDRCDITARDLAMIRSVFARLLSGLHHPRVQYPTSQENVSREPALAST